MAKKPAKEKVIKELSFLTETYSRYIGIDPGTAKTGLCIGSEDQKPDAEVIESTPGSVVLDKIIELVDKVASTIRSAPKALIVIENPFGIQGNGRVLLELVGTLKYVLSKQGHTIVMVPQTTLKKFATGAGNATKSDMVLKAYKEFKIDAGEDGADAFWLQTFSRSLLKKNSVQFRAQLIDEFIKKLRDNLNK